MKLLIPLGEVSEEALVTKFRGDKPFLVKDSVIIWGPGPGQEKTILAEEGARFLVSAEDGLSIHAWPSTTEVIWEITEEEATNLLEALVNKRSHQ